MTQKSPRSRLAYTTDPDPAPEASAEAEANYPSASSQTARIWRDSKRRRGKTVTVVGGLRHDPATLEALLKRLKQHCGAGGTLKDITKVNAYVTDVSLWPEFNRVYAEVMGEHRPARCVVPVPALNYGMKLEVEAVALLRTAD